MSFKTLQKFSFTFFSTKSKLFIKAYTNSFTIWPWKTYQELLSPFSPFSRSTLSHTQWIDIYQKLFLLAPFSPLLHQKTPFLKGDFQSSPWCSPPQFSPSFLHSPRTETSHLTPSCLYCDFPTCDFKDSDHASFHSTNIDLTALCHISEIQRCNPPLSSKEKRKKTITVKY